MFGTRAAVDAGLYALKRWLADWRQEVRRQLDDLHDRLAAIEVSLYRQGNVIMSDLSALTTEVQNTVGAEQSALVLIQGISAQLSAAGTDQAKLDALTASLSSQRAALAAAVAAGAAPVPGQTPAAPTAPVTVPGQSPSAAPAAGTTST